MLPNASARSRTRAAGAPLTHPEPPGGTPQRTRGSGLQRSYYLPAGHCPAALPLRVTEIGESWWPSGESCRRACSPVMALELVTQGTVHLDQDGCAVEVHAGEAFILKRGSRHDYRAHAGPVRKVYIGVAGPLAEDICARLPHRVVCRDPRRCLALFRTLRRLIEQPNDDRHAQASGVLYQLLVELLMSSRRERGEDILHPALARVLPVIEQRAGRGLGMSALARIAGVSAAHLHRLFRTSLHTSPQQYGVRLAMQRAQAQLVHSTRSCREIAADLGFPPLYFSVVFRRVVGLSPSEFRRQQR